MRFSHYLVRKRIWRNSCPEVFLGKGVLKIFSKFTGENPCRKVISIKLLCNFTEIAIWHGCSPVNLLHIFRTPFSKNTFGQLLLEIKGPFHLAQLKQVTTISQTCVNGMDPNINVFWLVILVSLSGRSISWFVGITISFSLIPVNLLVSHLFCSVAVVGQSSACLFHYSLLLRKYDTIAVPIILCTFL